jgi:hypothetical protein
LPVSRIGAFRLRKKGGWIPGMSISNFVPNAFTGLSSLALLLQTAGAGDLSGIITPIERLTLTGALVIGVRQLWVANARERQEHMRIVAEKDAIIIEMAKKVTETMVSVMDSVKELRGATEEIGAAMDNLAENFAAISAGFPVLKGDPRL